MRKILSRLDVLLDWTGLRIVNTLAAVPAYAVLREAVLHQLHKRAFELKEFARLHWCLEGFGFLVSIDPDSLDRVHSRLLEVRGESLLDTILSDTSVSEV